MLFRSCTGLETLVLPEGVTFLGGNAFGHAKLKSVSLPSTVAKMTATNEKSDANPFAFCENLEEIYVAEGNKAYKSDGNCVMRREDNTLVAGCKKSKIPSYTEHIGRSAFQGAALESVALPEGVTSIEDSAFAHNDRLKEITLPQSLTSIGKYAFLWCAALGKIAIPDGVTSVGDNAFSTCVSLKELALGAELLNAGCGLTELCVALEKITVSENNESFSGEGNCLTRKADSTVIAGCASCKIPAGTEQIGEYAGRAQKAHPDKIEDFLFRLRQRRNILLFKLDGRENGMVICDLAVVGYAGNVRSDRNVGEKRKLAADDRNDLTGSVLHIVRDELAVCARIGQELLFVECLYEIERLLGGEAIVSICLALQGG